MFHNVKESPIIIPLFIFYFICKCSCDQVQNEDSSNTCMNDLNCNCSTSYQVPNCMNVTIGKEHFNAESKTIDNVIGGYNIGTVSSFHLDNTSVSFCFPTSPQLKHCEVRKYGPGCYQVIETVLKLNNHDFKAELGDYYIDNHDNAYVCTEAIRADKNIPRCNFITIESGMFAVIANDSLYINSTGNILERTSYTIIGEGKANVCFPLSIHALNCEKYIIFAFNSYNYNLLPNMNIGYKSHNSEAFGPSEYYSISKHGDIRVCVPSSPIIEIVFYKIYYAFSQLSLTCLCLTLIFQLSTSQSKLHDKCLACYNLTVIGRYTRFAMRHAIPPEHCHSHFLFIFNLYMSSHVWLTLTTFDIWKSFSRMKTTPNQRILRTNITFIYYSIVGWGGPLLWYMLVLITNHYYNIFANEYTIDTPSCWFRTVWAFYTFYFGPILFLNVINIYFFVSTIRTIHREGKSAQPARQNGKKQVIIVCIKLFFIMGVSSIVNGIMLSIQYFIYFHHYYISDFFNTTQGIAIFVVVICRRQAIRAIRNHLTKLKLQWDALVIKSGIRNRRKNTIYIVEENHLNLRARQIACQSRAYILNDNAEGDTFLVGRNFVLETRL